MAGSDNSVEVYLLDRHSAVVAFHTAASVSALLANRLRYSLDLRVCPLGGPMLSRILALTPRLYELV
jgi:hypothetical protein